MTTQPSKTDPKAPATTPVKEPTGRSLLDVIGTMLSGGFTVGGLKMTKFTDKLEMTVRSALGAVMHASVETTVEVQGDPEVVQAINEAKYQADQARAEAEKAKADAAAAIANAKGK